MAETAAAVESAISPQVMPGVEANCAVASRDVVAGGRGGGRRSSTPHEFIWKYGGSKVILTGSFDEWSQSILMVRDHANGVFRATVNLDPTQTWYFKFVVDGVWRCSLDFCTETDATGNVNNILRPGNVI